MKVERSVSCKIAAFIGGLAAGLLGLSASAGPGDWGTVDQGSSGRHSAAQCGTLGPCVAACGDNSRPGCTGACYSNESDCSTGRSVRAVAGHPYWTADRLSEVNQRFGLVHEIYHLPDILDNSPLIGQH